MYVLAWGHLSLMWPVKLKELPTPALHGSVLLIVFIVVGFRLLDSMTGNIETDSFSGVQVKEGFNVQ